MIYAWGDNELATLGLGYKGRVKTRPAETLASWAGVVSLNAQASHTTGFFPDGHAEIVGGNDYDAACDGLGKEARIKTILTPLRIGVPGARVFSMCESAGGLILPDGTPLTWGSNILGQVGVGTWSEGLERLELPGVYTLPQRPFYNGTLTSLDGGQYHKLAITSTGQLIGWGDNRNGQVGDGTRKVKLVPTPLAHMIDPVVAVIGGGQHSLALRADGVPLGWGRGRYGEFGTVEQTPVLRPTVISLTGIKAISAGGSYSLFLTDAGTVLQTGHNSALHEVVLPGTCTAVSQGTVHALAVVDGEVFAWGQNEWGQLGDGTREDKSTPVALNIGAKEVSAGVIHSVAS